MRRVLVAAIAVVVALSCAAAARPGTTFVIKGKGWGHGLGLAQYGAYGFARDGGRNYEWILDHYYRGTTLGTAGVGRVRVLLANGASRLSVGSAAPFSVRDANGRTFNLNAGTHVLGSPLRIRNANGKLRRLASPVRFDHGSAVLRLSGNRYRGLLRVRSRGGQLSAVNDIGLEPYVKGVVAWEMPASWHPAGAQGASGHRPHLRPGEPKVRRVVRSLRRHAQPGLRRRTGGGPADERRRRRDQRRSRSLGWRARLDVLPLDLRRKNCVAPGRMGPARGLLPRQRRRPARQPLAASQVGADRWRRRLFERRPRLRLDGRRPQASARQLRPSFHQGRRGDCPQRLEPRRAGEAERDVRVEGDHRCDASQRSGAALHLVHDRGPPAERRREDRRGPGEDASSADAESRERDAPAGVGSGSWANLRRIEGRETSP